MYKGQALVEGDVYIELPEEAGVAPGMGGNLVRWIYGMRPAAQAWETLYAGKLEGAGFARGKGNGVMFYHEERDISVLVHGDDFVRGRRRGLGLDPRADGGVV